MDARAQAMRKLVDDARNLLIGEMNEALRLKIVARDSFSRRGNAAKRTKRQRRQAAFARAYEVERSSRTSHTAAIKRAAKTLGISESTAFRHAKELGLSAEKRSQK